MEKMTRAEKSALEAYPYEKGNVKYDRELVEEAHGYYIEGYLEAEKETIDYACYQLELRLPEVLNYQGIQVARKDFINDFKEAMLLD